MTLTTQDGRKIELSREYRLLIWTIHSDPQKSDGISITLEGEGKRVKGEHNFYYVHDVKLNEVIGTYPTELRREKVARMLRTAWQNGAEEFTMPQNAQLVLNEHEAVEDFCEANHLTMCAINEVGYTPQDTARNLHIWRTTDEFERQNIIICDEYGDYSKSLAKWQALRATA